MSRHRTAAATTGARSSPLRLPPAGLAHEILATPLATPTPPAPLAPRPEGPARIYAFADSLESRQAVASEPAEQPESWVTFEVAGELYALPVARIQEIQRAGGITRVPHAPPPVHGILNLRGRVLVVVDVRLRLGLPPAAVGERSRILVVSSRERSLGLLVDAAHQVVKLPASRIQPPPPDLMNGRSAFIAGVVDWNAGLLIVLDVEPLLLAPEEIAGRREARRGGTS